MRRQFLLVIALAIVLVLGGVIVSLTFTTKRAGPPSTIDKVMDEDDAPAPNGDGDGDGDDDPERARPRAALDKHGVNAPHAADDPPQPGDGRIEGVVVDERGAPVRAFEVSVTLSNPDAAHSYGADRRQWLLKPIDNEEGRFVVHFQPGRVNVSVKARGHRRWVQTYALEPNATLQLRVTLPPSNALRGVVRDATTRAPIDGAVISSFDIFVQTSADGRFEVLTLPETRFTIKVQAEGYRELVVGGFRGDRSRDEETSIELYPLSAGDGGPVSDMIGVGMLFERAQADEPVFITEVTPGTPAGELVRAGDLLIEVDGAPTKGVSDWDLREMVRGEAGTTLRIAVERAGVVHRFEVERKRISQ